MQLGNSKIKRLLGVALVVVAFAVMTFALTASNTVPASKAGDGSGGITGYSVSAIHYNLNVSNPQNIDSVTFTLNSAPAAGSTVKIQVDAPLGGWFACTMSGSPAVNASCPTAGATVALADLLTVVVAD